MCPQLQSFHAIIYNQGTTISPSHEGTYSTHLIIFHVMSVYYTYLKAIFVLLCIGVDRDLPEGI